MIVDISCDITNPNNPIPVYNTNTTYEVPFIRVVDDEKKMDVVSIDNLPSMIPKESSIEFSNALINELLKFEKNPTSGPWKNTLNCFLNHTH
jgi:saccharopine dehydrogenase (NAD+, L-lysine forming)